MKEQSNSKKEPAPERLAVLKKLPNEIVAQFSKKELNAFLFEDEWPDSLQDKLKNFLE